LPLRLTVEAAMDGYADYIAWCKAGGIKPMSKNQPSTALGCVLQVPFERDRKNRLFLKDVTLRGSKPTLVAVK
jgi:hypothetical protein